MFQKEVLTFAVPLISVFLSYLVGRLESIGNRKLSAYRHRYESFYIPYIRRLYAGHMYAGMKYSDLPLEQRSLFMDLLFEKR